MKHVEIRISVNLGQVVEATIDMDVPEYISVGLLFAPYHRMINPNGGMTTLVRHIAVDLDLRLR